MCRWSWRIESIEPTRNLFLKTVARVCSRRLTKTRKSKFENRQKQHNRPAFCVQGGNSHLFLETKNTRKSTFENRQTPHNLLAFCFQDSSSHLPLETEKNRESKFENRQKQHGRLAILSSIHFFIKKSFFFSIGKSMRGFVSETFF